MALKGYTGLAAASVATAVAAVAAREDGGIRRCVRRRKNVSVLGANKAWLAIFILYLSLTFGDCASSNLALGDSLDAPERPGGVARLGSNCGTKGRDESENDDVVFARHARPSHKTRHQRPPPLPRTKKKDGREGKGRILFCQLEWLLSVDCPLGETNAAKKNTHRTEPRGKTWC